MQVDLNKWHRCEVDKQEFVNLLKKSDYQGFKHMFIFFGSLIFFGYLAYATWGTWWTVVFFLSMEIFGIVQILFGMKQDTRQLLKLIFGTIFFIK